MSTSIVEVEEELPEEQGGRSELMVLGERMANHLQEVTKMYKREYKMTHEEAVEKATGEMKEYYREQLRTTPSDKITWGHFAAESDEDSAYVLERWKQICRDADDCLGTGQYAATAVEDKYDGDPWDRAQFLAIRHQLREDWKPNGTESLLVDTLAQAHYMQNKWTKIMVSYLSYDFPEPKMHEGERGYKLPRLDRAEAIEKAAQNIDRWNRLFLRTLRALRDLRRYSAQVTINNPGQVNIGEKQINVTS